MHCHTHLIPRRKLDIKDPRGVKELYQTKKILNFIFFLCSLCHVSNL